MQRVKLRRCITTHACTAAAAASGLVRRHTPDFLMPSNMHSCLLLGVAAVPSSFLFSPSPVPARSAAPSLPVRALPRSSAAPSLPSRTLPVCAALRPQLSTKSQTPSPLLRTSVPHPHDHHHHHSMQGIPQQLQQQQQQQRSLLVAAPCVAAAAVETAVAVASSNATAELVAVFIGHLVCIGSLFRSLPQIIKIVRHKSAEGLSITSHLTEVLCYTITMAYNVKHGYSFNTYGEIFACWIQDIILLSLIFQHLKLSRLATAASVATFLAVTTFMFSDACPPALLSWMFRATIGVMAFGARLPQIVLNVRRGNAGMMSLTTCCLNVAGNSARVFTTLVLVHDLNVLWGCLRSARARVPLSPPQGILNSILLYQTLTSRLAKLKAEKEGYAAKSRRAAGAAHPHIGLEAWQMAFLAKVMRRFGKSDVAFGAPGCS
ncbi:MAG: hypothetical protein WDW38_010621 [Sanguina aurantia]